MILKAGIDDSQIAWLKFQLLRCHGNQHFTRSRRCLAKLRRHCRRGATAKRSHIKRNKLGIAHYDANRSHRDVQFLGDRLSQRCPDVLPEFNFSGEGSDDAFFINVDPGADIVRQIVVGSAPASFFLLLRESASYGDHEENAEAKGLDELTTIKMEVVARCCE